MSDQVPQEKPTVKTLHDRVIALEAMLASVVSHVEGSLGFKVDRTPVAEDEAPADPNEPS